MYAEIKNSNKGTMVENSNDLIAFKATRRSRWIYAPYYCAFHTRTLKFKSCLHNCVFRCRQLWLRLQTSNRETHKTDRNLPITNHNWTMTFWTRWSKLLFPKRSAKMIWRQPSWLLNFRICVFLKSAVKRCFMNCIKRRGENRERKKFTCSDHYDTW